VLSLDYLGPADFNTTEPDHHDQTGMTPALRYSGQVCYAQ
jgi:hypothetical protein